jgi:cytochrome c peroxidase
MHNGFFATLDEVIDFIDIGGGKGNTALKPLGLSNEEKRLLKAFMGEALSGDDIKVSSPVIP